MDPPSTSSTSEQPALNLSVDPALDLLLVGAVGAAVLVPIALSFCYAHVRIRPRFLYFACLSVVSLGLVEGAVNVYVQTQALRQWDFASALNTTLVSLTLVIPILAQAALLVKIGCLYAWPALPWARRAALLLPSALLKIARIVLVALCIRDIHLYAGDAFPGGASASPWSALWGSSFVKAAWVTQLADDLYAYALLIARIWRGVILYARATQPHTDAQGSPVPPDTLSRRLVPVCLTTVSSFLPVLADVAQVMMACMSATNPRNGGYAGLCVVLANVYIEIVALLLVARWCPDLTLPASPAHSFTPDDVDPTSATRFLSPLPEHPRLHFSMASSASTRDSATLHADSDSTLGGEAEKLKIMEFYPERAAQSNWALEPSMCSFNGSVHVDAQGEPVFYAV